MVAAVPFAVFALRGIFRMEPWAAAPAGIVAGLLVLYAAAAPHFLLANPVIFLEDACASLIAGMLAFAILRRDTEHRMP